METSRREDQLDMPLIPERNHDDSDCFIACFQCPDGYAGCRPGRLRLRGSRSLRQCLPGRLPGLLLCTQDPNTVETGPRTQAGLPYPTCLYYGLLWMPNRPASACDQDRHAMSAGCAWRCRSVSGVVVNAAAMAVILARHPVVVVATDIRQIKTTSPYTAPLGGAFLFGWMINDRYRFGRELRHKSVQPRTNAIQMATDHPYCDKKRNANGRSGVGVPDY